MPSVTERPLSRSQSTSEGDKLTYDLSSLREIEHGHRKSLPDLAFRASYWARLVQKVALLQVDSSPETASDELKEIHRQLVTELLSTGDDLLNEIAALEPADVLEFTKWTGMTKGKIMTGIRNLEDDLADWHVPVSDFTRSAILEAAGLASL